MKLLLVEDNPALRQIIKQLVSPLAHEIYECADGAEAVAAWHTHHPDCVLMDIALGAMDGLTATRAITTADATAMVIIVTSYDEVEMGETAQRAGASGYVQKDNLLELPTILQTCFQLKEKKS